MRIFTLGTVTLQQGEIKDATPSHSVRATATIPIQASLPFGWLIVGVALLAVFQSASKIITLKKRWQLALSKGVHFVCNLLLLFVTVYSHLLLVAAGLEAPFLYLYALVYFLQSVNFVRIIMRLWLCWKCRSKNPLLYDANYFLCWHTNCCDYCIPYNSITSDYYQLYSTQLSTDTGIEHVTFFIYNKIVDEREEHVQIHTIDGSSGVVNPAMEPIYDEPTTTTSVPL